MDIQTKSCKLAEPLYQVSKNCVVYISRLDHQRKSCGVAESLYQVFEVTLSMYHEWITNQKVVKLGILFIKGLKLRVLGNMSVTPKIKL